MPSKYDIFISYGHLDDEDPPFFSRPGDEPPDLPPDAGMKRPFQKSEPRLGSQDPVPQPAAVDLAARAQDRAAEAFDDPPVLARPLPHEVVDHPVGVGGAGAEALERLGRLAFAARDAAGEADRDHAASFR